MFTVSNTNNSGPGSFRQAVLDSNATTGGVNTIDFNIPGAGPQTIPVVTVDPSLTDAFPKITHAVTIDGYSQPGSHPNTLAAGEDAALMIVLDGRQSQGQGLVVDADNVTIRGLAIGGFTSMYSGLGYGISTRGGRHLRIEGNFIGTDATGNQAFGNLNGVSIQGGADITIGGTTAAARNVISGNLSDGILAGGIDPNVPGGLVIQGNQIGTAAAGGVLSNANWGLEVFVNDTTVGGTAAGAGNVIQGNGHGFFLPGLGGLVLNTVGGDIKTNATGTVVLRNVIGPPQYLIYGQIEHSNRQRLGTNLGVPPMFYSAQTSKAGTVVRGTLVSVPSALVTVALYARAAADPADIVPLGTVTATTDVGGIANFTFTTHTVVPAGQKIGATVIDPKGNGSDLSPFVPVTALTATLAVHLTSSTASPIVRGALVYTARVTNTGPDAATRVGLSDLLPRGLEFVSARVSRGRAAASGNRIAVHLGRLAAGASATVTIVTRPVTAGTATNVVRVSADQFNPVPKGATAMVVVKVGASHPTVGASRPTVTSAQRIVLGRSRGQLVLTFSRGMQPSSVQNLGNYRLARLVRVSPRRVRLGPPIPLGTAVYDAASRTVALTPRRRRPLHGNYRLTVNGSAPGGLLDSTGRLLAGPGVIGSHVSVVVAPVWPVHGVKVRESAAPSF